MRLSPEANKVSRQNAGLIGLAMQLYSAHPQRREWNISRLGNLVISAVYHEKIRIFFSQDGNPVGLVIWAFPSESVQEMLLIEPNYVLHESEWDENGSLFIVDFIYFPSYLFSIMNELRHTTFSDYSEVKFIRAKDKANKRRMVSWKLK